MRIVKSSWLVHGIVGSREEETVLQDKDCRDTTFLFMFTACCMIYTVKRSTDTKVCIFVRVIREDMILDVPRSTSLVNNTLLEL